MSITALLMLALVADGEGKKPLPPAKVTITAETACTHCTFGFGDSCAVCLRLDDVTPIILEGKAAEEYFESRLTGTLLVVEGTLTVNKDKRMVLKSDKARPFADKDKGQAPAKGEVRIEGVVVLVKEAPAIRNGDHPIGLTGKHAEGKQETVLGILSLDKTGSLRLETKKAGSNKGK
jgi:hypothetical protein